MHYKIETTNLHFLLHVLYYVMLIDHKYNIILILLVVLKVSTAKIHLIIFYCIFNSIFYALVNIKKKWKIYVILSDCCSQQFVWKIIVRTNLIRWTRKHFIDIKTVGQVNNKYIIFHQSLVLYNVAQVMISSTIAASCI